jgi:hypothetical protein
MLSFIYVSSDDGAVRIMPLVAGRAALFAVAKRPEVRERVQAIAVPAFKRDLQRVLAHESYVLNSQLLRRQAADAIEAARCSRLTLASGAGARPAQLLARVSAVVAALPLDLHDLA